MKLVISAIAVLMSLQVFAGDLKDHFFYSDNRETRGAPVRGIGFVGGGLTCFIGDAASAVEILDRAAKSNPNMSYVSVWYSAGFDKIVIRYDDAKYEDTLMDEFHRCK